MSTVKINTVPSLKLVANFSAPDRSRALTPQTEVYEWERGTVALMLCDERETRHKSMKKELSPGPGFFLVWVHKTHFSVGLKSPACCVTDSPQWAGATFLSQSSPLSCSHLTFNVGNGEMGLLIWLWRSVNYIRVLYLLQISHCVITASVCGLKVEGSRAWELHCNSMSVHNSFRQDFNCRLPAYKSKGRGSAWILSWFIGYMLHNLKFKCATINRM